MSVLDVTLRSVAVLACFMVLPLVLGHILSMLVGGPRQAA